jgi:Domain of unknown function (DUF6438)
MDGNATDIASITLRRGPCFGTCPVYDVTLSADGTATWNGQNFVERMGQHQGQVDLNDYGRLSRFIDRAGFFDWAPEFLTTVTDLPDYFLTVVTGDETKTVRQNGVDRPADFWVIAALVDHLAEAIDWTPVAQPANCHDWTAVHRHDPPPPVLTVHGTCTFPTAGFAVELRRTEPQGINPRDLLLDRIVHAPTGPVAQVVTDVEALYIEHTDFDYETVTILPDGPSIRVECSQSPATQTADSQQS